MVYEDNGQLDQEIQKATNENFLNMIGEDIGDSLISLNKACEWLYQRQAVDLEVSDIEKFVKEFKKAMEE